MRRVWIAIFISVIANCAFGQAPEAPLHSDQYRALSDELGSLGALTPPDLLELSRLLSEPADQVNWLIERATATADLKVLKDLLDGVRGRITAAGRSLDPKLKKEIDQRLEALALKLVPRSLADILDIAQLKAELANPQIADDLANRKADEKFKLWARGVPGTRMGVTIPRRGAKPPTGSPGWLSPVMVATKLIDRDAPLTDVQELLRLETDLRAAEAKANKSPATSEREKATFKIALALLVRTLGGADRLTAADFKAMGDDLRGKPDDKSANLWIWAGLTKVLELGAAKPGSKEAERLVAEGKDMAERLHQIRAALPPKAGESDIGNHLLKLLTGEVASPLRYGARAQNDKWRDQAEKDFKDVWAAIPPSAVDANNANVINQLLKQMQIKKAAEIAVDQAEFNRLTKSPITIDELESALGSGAKNKPIPKVDHFVELIRCGEKYYGVAVRSKTGGLDETDSFLVETQDGDTPDAVVLNLVPKASKNEQAIIIAPDGAGPTKAWLSFPKLRDAISRGDTTARGWLVCVPTAAALREDGGGWTLDRVLRLWYRSSFGNTRLFLTPTKELTIFQGIGKVQGRPIYALGFGSEPPNDNAFWGDPVDNRLKEGLMKKLLEKSDRGPAISGVVTAKDSSPR